MLQGAVVEPQTILDVAGAVPEAAVTALMDACRSNSFQEVQEAITNTIADGFPVSLHLLRQPRLALHVPSSLRPGKCHVYYSHIV